MKIIRILLAAAGVTALTMVCVAQEEEATPRFTYASYFSCGGGPLARVDEIMADDADRMNGFMEDGTLAAWGWMAHHTGGQWQRISWYQADGMDALMDAGDAIQGSGDDADDSDDAAADDEDDGPVFREICPRHDDYIWQVQNGANSDARGDVGMSVYHVCDVSREERADEIVDEHFAPILNKMVEDGKLASWGWQSHVVGGHYRRLQTMSAGDVKSLMAARGEAIDVIYADDNEAGEEFTSICGDHADYIWNMQLESN
ncbi:MAG: hypothetical protein OEM25_02205 [Gammaproteobacteria bacterium]|nr:hypothetical protein [Gammaproteobacteria bacterium]